MNATPKQTEQQTQARIEQLEWLLGKAAWEIHYLHEKHGETISGTAVLTEILEAVPDAYEKGRQDKS